MMTIQVTCRMLSHSEQRDSSFYLGNPGYKTDTESSTCCSEVFRIISLAVGKMNLSSELCC